MGGAEEGEVTLSYFLLLWRESIDWPTLLLHLAVERKGKTRSGSKSSEAQNGGEPSRRQPIREPQGGSGTSN